MNSGPGFAGSTDTRRENWTHNEEAAAKQKIKQIIERGDDLNTAAANREIKVAVDAVGGRSEHGVKRKSGQITGDIAAEYYAEKRQLTHENAAKNMVIATQNAVIAQKNSSSRRRSRRTRSCARTWGRRARRSAPSRTRTRR